MEAIVAMVVCTVGLVSLAELMAATLRMQQLSQNSTQAVRLAQDKIDELTTLSFATDLSVACGGSLTADVANHNDVPGNGAGYRRRWVVAAGPDGDTNLREVTVRVIPDVRDARTASTYSLTTIIRGLPVAC